MPSAAQRPPEILPSTLPGQVERILGPVSVASGVERHHHFLCWIRPDLGPSVEIVLRTREASSPTLRGEFGILGRTALLYLPFGDGGVVSTYCKERQALAFDLRLVDEGSVEEQELVVEVFAVSRPGVAPSDAGTPR